MNREDRHIDFMARQAVRGQQFTYHPDYFKEVESLLPTPSKKRRFAFWWWVILPISGVLLSAGWYFHSSYSPSTSDGIYLVDWSGTAKESTLAIQNNHEQHLHRNASGMKATEKQRSTKSSMDPLQSPRGGKSIMASITTVANGASGMKTKDRSIQLALPSESGAISRLETRGTSFLSSPTNHSIVPNSPTFKILEPEVWTEQPIDLLPTATTAHLNWGENRRISPFVKAPRIVQSGLFVAAVLSAGSLYENETKSLHKSLSLGAGYQRQKGYWGWSFALLGEINWTKLQFVQQSKHYSYSVTSYENRLSYSNLYHLEAPLWIHFHQGKNQWHTGPSLNYVVSSRSNYTYMANNEKLREDVMIGEDLGLRRANFQWQLGYARALHHRLHLGLNAAYQLNDPLKKDGFESNVVVSPFVMQVYIRHSIR